MIDLPFSWNGQFFYSTAMVDENLLQKLNMGLTHTALERERCVCVCVGGGREGGGESGSPWKITSLFRN